MNNLESLSQFKELSSNELENINGGVVCAGACMFIIGVVVGIAVSYALS
ncbi:class IIb bacteriocin, lactobin A/cerein 7B family [Aquimarina sp. 2201CG1-2-11]